MFSKFKFLKRNVEMIDVMIVSTVEPFENIDRDTLPWRSGKIHNFLLQNSISTKIITSTFNHYNKSFRTNINNSNFIFLKSVAYQKNISILRFLNYCIHVPQLIRLILKYRPKLVLITVPPVVHLLAIFIIKIIDPKIKFWVDVRDLWPEIFVEKFSKIFTRTGANVLFSASFRLRTISLNLADYVTTISPIFVDILSNNNSSFIKKINWFPHPKAVVPLDDTSTVKHVGKVKFVYIGSLSLRTDLVNFVREVALFVGKSNCEFIIGGRGFLENSINELKEEGINVNYLGWVPGVEVNGILKHADFGMIPYPASIDFDASFPNKYLEYCALGMRSVSRPLSIYSHDDVPLKIRPYVLDRDFENILKTRLTDTERHARQSVFEAALSEVKMQKYATEIVSDLLSKSQS